MAVQVAANPRWRKNESGRYVSTIEKLVDGGMTCKAGEFLRADADGLLYEAITSATSVAASATTHYATEDLDATIGADTTRKLVGIVAASDQYEMNELDNAVTDVMIGNQYSIDVTSNLCTLDTGNNTYQVFTLVMPFWRIREFQDASADTLARVIAQPLTVNVEAAPA